MAVVFGFFGIDDVRIVRAEGLSMGEAPRTAAIGAARAAILSLGVQATNEEAVAA